MNADTSESASTLFGTYPPDPEFDGIFSKEPLAGNSSTQGKNEATWGPVGQLLNIDKYSIGNRKKGTFTTSCFKRLRIRVSYDPTKTCDPYAAPSDEALTTSGAAMSLQVTVGPFKASERHLATGPFLTVVDRCPIVHSAAVAAANRVLQKAPLIPPLSGTTGNGHGQACSHSG